MRIERLPHVIVRSRFQSLYPVPGFFPCGQKQDGHVTHRPQRTREGEPVFARHAYVKHDQVIGYSLQAFLCFAGISSDINEIPLPGKIPLQEISQPRIIVNDKQPGID